MTVLKTTSKVSLPSSRARKPHKRHRAPVLQSSGSRKPQKSPSSNPRQTFSQFSILPVEIRLRIWAFFANSNPRNLDIWTDYTMCRQGNTTFYHQTYFCHLANKSPHPILSVGLEAREEGLRHFTLEYETVFQHKDLKQVNPARFYVNYAYDTLVPRGYWNICSYIDLMKRNFGLLKNLAVDVSGSFWRDQIAVSMEKGTWLFEGLENLVLYDTSKGKVFKDDVLFGERDCYEEFKKRWDGKIRDTRFVEAEGGRMKLFDAAEKLVRYFKKQNEGIVDSPLSSTFTRESSPRIDGSKEVEKKTEFLVHNGDQTTRIQIKQLEIA